MKVLQLRFENLNSLRGPHLVDFENGPLRDVSLFAITGPTGAGKSTLLDALTLALYGRAARYGSAPSPEDMMSRHTGRCSAEVWFATDEGRFRAEWQLHRARDRPDGKLQLPQRRVYDAAGVTLAQNTTESDRKVEELIGLNCERFLRSALLAQGEFARFLKANANERAGLLECLTGTEIYSDLGQLAHEEAGRRENAVAQMRAELGAIALLDDVERAERETALAERERAAGEARTALDALEADLAAAHALAQARAEEGELLAAQASLAARDEAAAPDRARLEGHRRTVDLAADLARADAARDGAAGCRASLAAAKTERERAGAERDRTRRWAATFAETLVCQKHGEVASLRERCAGADLELAALAAERLAHAADGDQLATALPTLADALADLRARRQALADARTRADGASGEVRKREEILANADLSVAEARAACSLRNEAEAAALTALHERLGGATVPERHAALEALQARRAALENLALRAETGEAQRRELTADRAALTRGALARDAAREHLVGLEPRLAPLKEQVELRRDHLNKARLVAGFEVHRAALAPGAECPLCGATAHPFAAAGAVPTSGELARIAASLTAAERELAGLQAELAAAGTAVSRAEANVENLAGNVRRGETAVAAHADELRRTAAAHGLPDEDAAGSYRDAVVEIADRQTVAKAELQAIGSAEAVAATAGSARLTAENALQRAADARDTARRELAAGRAQAATDAAGVARLEETFDLAAGKLTAALLPFGVPLPEAGRETAARDDLTRRQTAQRQRTETSRARETTCQTLRRDLADAETILGTLTNLAADLRARTVADGGTVPPGADVSPPAEWSALPDAERAVELAEAAVGAAGIAVRERARAVAESDANARQLGEQLTARLVVAGFDSLDALRAARLEPPAVSALEENERALAAEVSQVQWALTNVRRVLAGLRARGDVPEDDAGLTGLVGRVSADRATHEARLSDLGQRRAELARDAEARERSGQKAAEIAAESERLFIWKQLQTLIGSHDGAKFRRYAQGISLDLLVRRANVHLRRLNERYTLRRRAGGTEENLDLDIVDAFQGDATRPMASLSGGESFLSSLALALGLADLAGRKVRIESLFIDEGFGSLDADSLDAAIAALDGLRRDHKTVGVISHVELLKERITAQIVVEKHAGGVSRLSIRGGRG